jgi:Lipocalin-like domain
MGRSLPTPGPSVPARKSQRQKKAYRKAFSRASRYDARRRLWAGKYFDGETGRAENTEDTMKHLLASAAAMALVLSLAQPAASQDLASQIVGVWKLQSQHRKDVATGKTVHTYGEKPTGHLIYTKGGHVSFIVAGDGRKAPASPNATDAEIVGLFKSSSFGSGTYRVEGNKLVVRYETSWHQLWTGTERSGPPPEISGKTLTTTTAPFKSPLDGAEVVVVTTWERVE